MSYGYAIETKFTFLTENFACVWVTVLFLIGKILMKGNDAKKRNLIQLTGWSSLWVL